MWPSPRGHCAGFPGTGGTGADPHVSRSPLHRSLPCRGAADMLGELTGRQGAQCQGCHFLLFSPLSREKRPRYLPSAESDWDVGSCLRPPLSVFPGLSIRRALCSVIPQVGVPRTAMGTGLRVGRRPGYTYRGGYSRPRGRSPPGCGENRALCAGPAPNPAGQLFPHRPVPGCGTPGAERGSPAARTVLGATGELSAAGSWTGDMSPQRNHLGSKAQLPGVHLAG